MCGICGIIGFSATYPEGDAALSIKNRLSRMTTALQHRGPDGEGYFTSPSSAASFGHRRLAIIDLSPAAAQPMHYLDRYTLIFNGEIYNYLELKALLTAKGYQFRTSSDTEVLLAAYDAFSTDCLNQLDGMFAFTIWDEKEKTLFAARDRFGEKPFYYAVNDQEFCFASEKKALWAAGIEKKINDPLLLNFLVLGYTQTPLDKTITYHQDIYSLPPAHYLLLNAREGIFNLVNYWDCDKQAKQTLSESAAMEKFSALLEQSVQRRLRSDVGYGCSLSGGLDSASIAALICRQMKPPTRLQTFSAVFPGFKKDETHYIGLMQEAFPLSGHTVSPQADDLIKDFEKLCYHQEEPFISSSIFAQYKVYELAASKGVKVLLDGQGADETLAGYDKYIPWYLQELLRKKWSSLAPERRELRKNNASFSWGWRNYLAAWYPAQTQGFLENREARKLRNQPDIDPGFKKANLDRHSLYKPLVLQLNDMLYFNSFQSGLEDLLRYADRNSMAHGREIRLPFLSHELVEFIFSLPAVWKIHEGYGKWILRKSMQAALPQEIAWRKDKVGYEPPQEKWMGNKQVADYIHEAKKKLVAKQILLPAVLNKKIQPRDVLAAENADWRYLVVAGCMD